MNKRKHYNVRLVAGLIGLSLCLLAPVARAQVVTENHFVNGDNLTLSGQYQKDLYVFGNDINFDGTVAGDVFIAGNNIKLTGEVGGDIFFIGNDVKIDTHTQGSVRGFGGHLVITGTVGRNLVVWGGRSEIDADVAWHTTVYGGELAIRGEHQRVDITGDTITVSGVIDGPLVIKNFGKRSETGILATARIGGNLDYTGRHDPNIAPGAEIGGRRDIKKMTAIDASEAAFGAEDVFSWLVGFFGLLAVGLVVLSLWGRPVEQLTQQLREKNYRLILPGFILLLAVPIGILLLFVSVIGIPLSLLLLCFYLAYLYLSQIFVSLMIGEFIRERWQRRPYLQASSGQRLFFTLLIGLFAFRLIVVIPVVGLLVQLVAVLLVGGVIFQLFRERWQSS